METATLSLKEEITAAYLDYVLTHGHRPVSVFAFAKNVGIAEEAFYQNFANFYAIEQRLWLDAFESTVTRLQGDATYRSYSAREKLLAFYFLWLEGLLPKRSFVDWSQRQISSQERGLSNPIPYQLLKPAFLRFADDIVNEGLDKGELVARPLVTDRYSQALWMQLIYLTRFWARDTSEGFQDSDAAVEKSVRLSFELMGTNVVDAITDFAKFMWQRR